MLDHEKTKEDLFKVISEKVFIKNYNEDFSNQRKDEWIFDFRNTLLKPEYLDLSVSVLWDKIKTYDNIQIGGMESASIPLITGLILLAYKNGKKVNGFYIRKSRKKSGLYKQIEGELNDDPIILIDDLINSGGSIAKQIEVLEEDKRNVFMVVTLLRFRKIEDYLILKNKNIKIESVFKLEDFGLKMKAKIKYQEYNKELLYQSYNAAYKYVVTKSVPVISGSYFYHATDNGFFYAKNKHTFENIWEFKAGYGSDSKHIFSSPEISNDLIIFGAYDGNVYALDRYYGYVRWVFGEADYVGSSPAVAEDLGLVFIGLEFGLHTRRGGVVAIKTSDGSKVWEFHSSAYTHASPFYIKKFKSVCIGGNEGLLSLFNAETGEVIWQFETEGGSKYEGVVGFSEGDIKLSPVYDEETDQIAFSSMDGYVYVLERETGKLNYRMGTDYPDTTKKAGVFGSPLFTGKFIFFAGLDKTLYCYDKKNGELIWKYTTEGRIFSTPVEEGLSIFIGSNDGCLYEFEKDSGAPLSKTYFSERITNKVIFDTMDNIRCLYVTTQTNQIYRLTK